MLFPVEDLYIDHSTIPSSGLGLFTRRPINKGTIIVEYEGRITNWEDVRHDASNVYIYFISEDHVIDAKDFPHSLARYMNDAQGLTRVKGIVNNCRFIKLNGKIFIRSTKNIPAHAELFVDYGAAYWDTVKKNIHIKNLTSSNHH
jgi:SET domain-containing protein